MEKAVAEAEKEDIQRWTTKRKAALVPSILKGETSAQAAARQHGITVAELEAGKSASCWQQRTLCELGPRTRRPCARSRSRS